MKTEEILEIDSGNSAQKMKEELGMSEHEINLTKLKALQKLIKHNGIVKSDTSSETSNDSLAEW